MDRLNQETLVPYHEDESISCVNVFDTGKALTESRVLLDSKQLLC